MLLYAETHYPRRWPSATRRAEPEIVTDLPWRIEPGAPLPVLLAVRDAHWFPVRIEAVAVEIRAAADDRSVGAQEFPVGEDVAAPWWWRLVEVPPPPSGAYRVATTVRYAVNNRSRAARIDNYRGTSHAPFRLDVAEHAWPVPPGWLAGDAHVHTAYTRDQVEFGPPVAAISAMSRAMGVRWAALTDHSYDLDDREETYLRNDPALPRWHGLLRDVAAAGADPILIAGEEVSCGNARGRNIHLLALGIGDYIPGAGDSAERPLHTRPDLPVGEVVRRAHRQGGIAIAAHPGDRPPWGERIVFRRGAWEEPDLAGPIDGAQFWNGERDAGFSAGYAAWVRLLLAGYPVAAVAGNDSHGAFGRSRRVRLPWALLADDRRQLFGRARTIVHAAHPTPSDILAALAGGESYLTDGPAIALFAIAGEARHEIGARIDGTPGEIVVRARSTPEWGPIRRIDFLCGTTGADQERRLARDLDGTEYAAEWTVPFAALAGRADGGPGYIRAEVRTTRSDGADFFALANPIWINGAGRPT